MFPKIDPTTTSAWAKLQSHLESEMQHVHMRDLFASDANRFEKFNLQLGGLLLDYSKNRITAKTKELLIELAHECKLSDAIQAQFSGQHINETEDRAVYHVGLRDFSTKTCSINNKEVHAEIEAVRQKMKQFCDSIHSGERKGFSGKKIKNIVNIGIGGSDLGPLMVTEALKPFWKNGIQTYFISNVDGTHITETLKNLNPEETLFVIASKTFTTQETMTNATSARNWFLNHVNDENAIKFHFAAVSTNSKLVGEFGIAAENTFTMWDWVCGRFSMWGATGLSIALTLRYENFESFLKGAELADRHFENEAFENNIPVILAMLSVWYINFWDAKSEVILCYDQYLHKFATYFQQGFMESNGKTIDRNGNRVSYSTGVPIWGESGTNGQHSFHQLIHQGSSFLTCDFIAPVKTQNPVGDHHDKLLANFLAQTEALMFGKTQAEVQKEDSSLSNYLSNFKTFEGNKPTNSILLDEVNPFNLGTLVALYEHKIFVQSVVWNIFGFDQWGVELGKVLSNKILPVLKTNELNAALSNSTVGLLKRIKNVNEH